jgi:hypothetical protein
MQKPTPPPLANTAKKTDSDDNDEGSDVDERNQQDHIDDYTVRPFSCVLVAMWSIATRLSGVEATTGGSVGRQR